MGFNYGLEKKKFDAEWARLRAEYAEAGMDEAAIQEMYEYDLSAFRRRRTEALHEQPLTSKLCDDEEENDESKSALYGKFVDKLSCVDNHFAECKFGWIESIQNEALYSVISTLCDRDKELLTLLIAGYTRNEIANMRGVKVQAINKKVGKLKILLQGVVF